MILKDEIQPWISSQHLFLLKQILATQALTSLTSALGILFPDIKKAQFLKTAKQHNFKAWHSTPNLVPVAIFAFGLKQILASRAPTSLTLALRLFFPSTQKAFLKTASSTIF